MGKWRPLLFFAALLVFGGLFSHCVNAQDAIPSQLDIPARVFVDNLKLSQKTVPMGQPVTGSFTLSNGAGQDVPEVYYTIALVGNFSKNGLPTSVLATDQRGPLYLHSNEQKSVPFSYTLPDGIAGDNLGIRVQAHLKSGFLMGWADAPLSIHGVSHWLRIKSSSIVVNGKKYGAEEGPTVTGTQKLEYVFTAENPTSADITVTPHVSVSLRAADSAPEPTIQASPVTVVAHQSQEMRIPIPFQKDPAQVYVGTMVLVDDSDLPRSAHTSFRYIVGGDIATIQSVQSNQEMAQAGTPIAITVHYSGTPFDVATGKTPTLGTGVLHVALRNDQGQEIGSADTDIRLDTPAGVQTVTVTPIPSAGKITATAEIRHKGTVLDHSQAIVTSDAPRATPPAPPGTNHNSPWTVLVIGIVIVIGLFVLAQWRSDRTTLGIFFFLLLLAGTGYGAYHVSAYEAQRNIWSIDNEQGMVDFQNYDQYCDTDTPAPQCPTDLTCSRINNYCDYSNLEGARAYWYYMNQYDFVPPQTPNCSTDRQTCQTCQTYKMNRNNCLFTAPVIAAIRSDPPTPSSISSSFGADVSGTGAVAAPLDTSVTKNYTVNGFTYAIKGLNQPTATLFVNQPHSDMLLGQSIIVSGQISYYACGNSISTAGMFVRIKDSQGNEVMPKTVAGTSQGGNFGGEGHAMVSGTFAAPAYTPTKADTYTIEITYDVDHLWHPPQYLQNIDIIKVTVAAPKPPMPSIDKIVDSKGATVTSGTVSSSYGVIATALPNAQATDSRIKGQLWYADPANPQFVLLEETPLFSGGIQAFAFGHSFQPTQPGTATIKVVSCDPAGNCSDPAIVQFPVNGKPGVPTNLNATGNDKTVTLRWKAPGGATVYHIFRSTSTGGITDSVLSSARSTPCTKTSASPCIVKDSTSGTSAIAGTATSATDADVMNGTPYYYKMEAMNGSLPSGLSNEASATPSVPQAWYDLNVTVDPQIAGFGEQTDTVTVNVNGVSKDIPINIYVTQAQPANPNVYGWAWAGGKKDGKDEDTVGWISMNCSNNQTCLTGQPEVIDPSGSGHNYGVKIEDYPQGTQDKSGTDLYRKKAKISGFAWSGGENQSPSTLGDPYLGWLCFGESCPGTPPDGGDPNDPNHAGHSYATIDIDPNGAAKDSHYQLGRVTGWARALSLGKNGWIQLGGQDKKFGAYDTFPLYIDVNHAVQYTDLKDALKNKQYHEFRGWGWSNGGPSGTTPQDLHWEGQPYPNAVGWVDFNCKENLSSMNCQDLHNKPGGPTIYNTNDQCIINNPATPYNSCFAVATDYALPLPNLTPSGLDIKPANQTDYPSGAFDTECLDSNNSACQYDKNGNPLGMGLHTVTDILQDEPFTLSTTIRNSGGADIPPDKHWDVTFYDLANGHTLVSDQVETITPPEQVLATVNQNGPLAIGSSLVAATPTASPITFPTTVTPGLHYFWVKVDPPGKGVIAESDETDNVIGPFWVRVRSNKPDLTVTSLTLSTTHTTWSQPVKLSATIQNIGPRAVPAGQELQVLFSAVAHGGDAKNAKRIGSLVTVDATNSQLQPQQSITVSSNDLHAGDLLTALGADTQPGTVDVIATVNPPAAALTPDTHSIIEGDYTNNQLTTCNGGTSCSFTADANPPDLVISGAMTANPSVVKAGDTVTISATIKNAAPAVGASVTVPFNTALYKCLATQSPCIPTSNDSALQSNNPSFVKVFDGTGSTVTPPLAANNSITISTALITDATLAQTTTYQFCAWTDYGNAVDETGTNGEANNGSAVYDQASNIVQSNCTTVKVVVPQPIQSCSVAPAGTGKSVIQWVGPADTTDVNGYVIRRYDASTNALSATIPASGFIGTTASTFTDQFSCDTPPQYIYKMVSQNTAVNAQSKEVACAGPTDLCPSSAYLEYSLSSSFPPDIQLQVGKAIHGTRDAQGNLTDDIDWSQSTPLRSSDATGPGCTWSGNTDALLKNFPQCSLLFSPSLASRNGAYTAGDHIIGGYSNDPATSHINLSSFIKDLPNPYSYPDDQWYLRIADMSDQTKLIVDVPPANTTAPVPPSSIPAGVSTFQNTPVNVPASQLDMAITSTGNPVIASYYEQATPPNYWNPRGYTTYSANLTICTNPSCASPITVGGGTVVNGLPLFGRNPSVTLLNDQPIVAFEQLQGGIGLLQCQDKACNRQSSSLIPALTSGTRPQAIVYNGGLVVLATLNASQGAVRIVSGSAARDLTGLFNPKLAVSGSTLLIAYNPTPTGIGQNPPVQVMACTDALCQSPRTFNTALSGAVTHVAAASSDVALAASVDQSRTSPQSMGGAIPVPAPQTPPASIACQNQSCSSVTLPNTAQFYHTVVARDPTNRIMVAFFTTQDSATAPIYVAYCENANCLNSSPVPNGHGGVANWNGGVYETKVYGTPLGAGVEHSGNFGMGYAAMQVRVPQALYGHCFLNGTGCMAKTVGQGWRPTVALRGATAFVAWAVGEPGGTFGYAAQLCSDVQCQHVMGTPGNTATGSSNNPFAGGYRAVAGISAQGIPMVAYPLAPAASQLFVTSGPSVVPQPWFAPFRPWNNEMIVDKPCPPNDPTNPACHHTLPITSPITMSWVYSARGETNPQTQWRVQVARSTDLSFASPVADSTLQSGSATTYTLPNRLANDPANETKYYWRVGVHDQLGLLGPGVQWSQPQQFFVRRDPPVDQHTLNSAKIVLITNSSALYGTEYACGSKPVDYTNKVVTLACTAVKSAIGQESSGTTVPMPVTFGDLQEVNALMPSSPVDKDPVLQVGVDSTNTLGLNGDSSCKPTVDTTDPSNVKITLPCPLKNLDNGNGKNTALLYLDTILTAGKHPAAGDPVTLTASDDVSGIQSRVWLSDGDHTATPGGSKHVAFTLTRASPNRTGLPYQLTVTPGQTSSTLQWDQQTHKLKRVRDPYTTTVTALYPTGQAKATIIFDVQDPVPQGLCIQPTSASNIDDPNAAASTVGCRLQPAADGSWCGASQYNARGLSTAVSCFLGTLQLGKAGTLPEQDIAVYNPGSPAITYQVHYQGNGQVTLKPVTGHDRNGKATHGTHHNPLVNDESGNPLKADANDPEFGVGLDAAQLPITTPGMVTVPVNVDSLPAISGLSSAVSASFFVNRAPTVVQNYPILGDKARHLLQKGSGTTPDCITDPSTTQDYHPLALAGTSGDPSFTCNPDARAYNAATRNADGTIADATLPWRPTFSWTFQDQDTTSPNGPDYPTGYTIEVRDSSHTTVWSKTVSNLTTPSDTSTGVATATMTVTYPDVDPNSTDTVPAQKLTANALYQWRVKVSDANGGESSWTEQDFKTFRTPRHDDPQAFYSEDETVVLVNTEVHFNNNSLCFDDTHPSGTGHACDWGVIKNPDGTISDSTDPNKAHAFWMFVDQSASPAPIQTDTLWNPQHQFLEGDKHNVVMTVIDQDQYSSSGQTLVLPQNIPPPDGPKAQSDLACVSRGAQNLCKAPSCTQQCLNVQTIQFKRQGP